MWFNNNDKELLTIWFFLFFLFFNPNCISVLSNYRQDNYLLKTIFKVEQGSISLLLCVSITFCLLLSLFWRLFRTYMAYSRVNQESSYAKEVISCSRFVFLENDSRHTDLQRGFLSPKFLGNCLRKTNMESRRMQSNILIGVSYQVQDFIDDACFGWSKMVRGALMNLDHSTYGCCFNWCLSWFIVLFQSVDSHFSSISYILENKPPCHNAGLLTREPTKTQ